MNYKIGLMLPKSDMYPALALDFMKGLKIVFANSPNAKWQPNFVVESIGNASDEIVLKIAKKLVLQEEVDVVISFCSIFDLDQLVKLFDSYKKPLIHVDLGGNVLKKEHISPFVLHHSLNLCQAAYESGVYAAKNYGKNALILSSFYDGGYQIHSSFEKGFMTAGGEMVSYYVSPHDYKEQSYDALITRIEEEAPDVMFGLYSYKEGNALLDVFSKASFNGKIPFITTPIMTDESVITQNYSVENVHSIASWSFDDERPEMTAMISEYMEKYEEQPNLFSLLGYECGQLLLEYYQDGKDLPNKIGTFFADRSLNTPRGKVQFNNYYETMPETFALRAFTYNEIKYHNTIVETIDISKTVQLNQQFEGQPLTGWKNPYICT